MAYTYDGGGNSKSKTGHESMINCPHTNDLEVTCRCYKDPDIDPGPMHGGNRLMSVVCGACGLPVDTHGQLSPHWAIQDSNL